jgi:hypothetical protein
VSSASFNLSLGARSVEVGSGKSGSGLGTTRRHLRGLSRHVVDAPLLTLTPALSLQQILKASLPGGQLPYGSSKGSHVCGLVLVLTGWMHWVVGVPEQLVVLSVPELEFLNTALTTKQWTK